jgi:hypothetical protein
LPDKTILIVLPGIRRLAGRVSVPTPVPNSVVADPAVVVESAVCVNRTPETASGITPLDH